MTNSLPKQFQSKITCKKCQQETWHIILNETETSWDDEESGLWEKSTYFTLQCAGCENVCLLIHYYFSEDIDTRTGDPELQASIHPSPYKDAREPINGLYHVPKDVKTVYEEALKALNSGMMILAAVGIRTIIEAIAIEQKITIKGIKTKIDKMVDRGIITSDGAKLLMLVKDIGNLATHEIKKQHHDDLSLCMDIVEGVFRGLYIHPKEAENTKNIADGKWVRV